MDKQQGAPVPPVPPSYSHSPPPYPGTHMPPAGYAPPPQTGIPPQGMPPQGIPPQQGVPQGYPAPQPAYTVQPGYTQQVIQPQQAGYTQQATTTVVMAQPAVTTTVVRVGGNCPACGVGILTEEYSVAGIILAIVFFPWGILCCLAMTEKRCSHCRRSY